jgi:hypothetical protein
MYAKPCSPICFDFLDFKVRWLVGFESYTLNKLGNSSSSKLSFTSYLRRFPVGSQCPALMFRLWPSNSNFVIQPRKASDDHFVGVLLECVPVDINVQLVVPLGFDVKSSLIMDLISHVNVKSDWIPLNAIFHSRKALLLLRLSTITVLTTYHVLIVDTATQLAAASCAAAFGCQSHCQWVSRIIKYILDYGDVNLIFHQKPFAGHVH